MISLPSDLSQRVEAKVASGAYSSAEDVLYAALDALAMPEEEEDLAAIRRGLAELEAGLGTPFEESERAFRQRNGLAPRK
jgi:Arc/MetJ-type ribon-helix-helix transcriptional regulator